MSDLIDRQDAIDILLIGKEFLMRVLDDADVVGQDREKYPWGLGLIESCIDDIEELPSAEPKITHCKDCRNRGEDECPMRHVERIEWEEDGYIEVDDIVHDYTEPHGYCDKGERNE